MSLKHDRNQNIFNLSRLNQHSLYLNKNKSCLRKSLKYTYKFASIISPGSLKNMTLVSRSKLNLANNNTIYIKQSYVLLTWMTYIKEIQSRTGSQQVSSTSGVSDDSLTTPSFFIHPPKRSRLTFLKAPMAHKTFSQEQFMNKSYNLTISFNSSFRKQANINTVNSSLYIALYLRNTCLPTETNLLFLKKLRMSITSKDVTFMSL